MILLNPGPVNVSPRVTAALGRGDLCHREPECTALLRRIRERLLAAFAPAGGFTAVLITGSGTAALEAAVTSSISAYGRLAVIDNGIYGDRIVQMAGAARIPYTVIKGEWTAPPDLDAVERVLRAPDVEAVAIVHHETTTGLRNPVAEVGKLAQAYGKRLIVDSVSGLAGDPLDLDAVGASVVAGTGNKCIQGIPGMAFVLVREDLMTRLRTYPRRSLYLSLPLYDEAARRDTTPFTPAIQAGYALDEALAELLEETVAGRIARYAAAAAQLRTGFAALGLESVLPAELQSNTITSLFLPAGVTYATLHDGLKDRGFVIYEGQGRLQRAIFRVANMGHLTRDDFARFLAALGEVLRA